MKNHYSALAMQSVNRRIQTVRFWMKIRWEI